jgi:hypothetical protein
MGKIKMIKFKKSPFSFCFSFYGTIYLTTRCFEKQERKHEAILKHELTHIRQQGFGFIENIIWVIKYFISKDFRYEMEKEAFIEEIKHRYMRLNLSLREKNKVINI